MKPLPKYNLEKTQIYPLGSNFYESIKDGLKINFENLSLSEQTSYASIGTCFAEEFSTYLKESNIGKYITLEDYLGYENIRYKNESNLSLISFPYHIVLKDKENYWFNSLSKEQFLQSNMFVSKLLKKLLKI